MSVLPHEGTFPILYGSYGVPVGSGFRRGYLARPDQAGRFPVVIVVPGTAGLSPSHKDLSRRFARRGLATLALDAAGGEEPTGDTAALHEVDEAIEFVMSADIDWAIRAHVGLLGLQEGAGPAVGYAASRPPIAAVALVEPVLDDGAELESIPCPVAGFYGANDPASAVAAVASPVSWIVYEGAGRGFFDDGTPGYHPAAAADALERMAAFLTGYLPAPELDRPG